MSDLHVQYRIDKLSVERLAQHIFEARAAKGSRPSWDEADESEKANFYRDAKAALEWFKVNEASH